MQGLPLTPPRSVPFQAPGTGEPLKLVFVGQSTFFEACSLGNELREVQTWFIDFRAGADPERMLTQVRDLQPHVTVVFRPELVPRGGFAHLSGLTLGFLTEPIPRKPGKQHPDLRRRLDDLRAVDPSNFDRLVSFDPLMAEMAATIAPIWRSTPLPVADRYFRDVRPLHHAGRALFIGRSTPHREMFLTPAKHRHDLLHVAHGVDADMLAELFGEHDVAVNIHNESYPSFENRVPLHLAAGHLVLSEVLSPTHGLEPNIDYMQIETPFHLEYLLTAINRFPSAFQPLRFRGRAKAELYRASSVYPRLIHDLYLDVAAFGTLRSIVG